MKENKGITLVALIITIIILLILALVSINAVNGDGIIKHATKAKDDTITQQEKEQLDIWVLTVETEKLGKLDYDELDKIIDKNLFSGSNGVYESKKTGNKYLVKENGTVCSRQEEPENITDIYASIEPYASAPGKKILVFTNKTNENAEIDYGKIPEICESSSQSRKWAEKREDIVRIEIRDSLKPKSTRYWFASLGEVKEIIGLENLYTSEVTDMQGMFRACNSLRNIDLRGLDTTNVQNMSEMFGECTCMISINLNGISTKSLINMDDMFNGCDYLKDIKWNTLDTANVQTIEAAFYGCENLQTTLTMNFNVSKLESYEKCFRYTTEPIVIRCKLENKDIAELVAATAEDNNVTVEVID